MTNAALGGEQAGFGDPVAEANGDSIKSTPKLTKGFATKSRTTPTDQPPRFFIRWVFERNPFYLFSALLVLFGLSRAFAAGEGTHSAVLLASLLGGYSLCLSVAGIAILKITRSWEDLPSILLILLLLGSAMGFVFDERIAASPAEVKTWGLSVFAFLVLLSTLTSKGMDLKLGAGFHIFILTLYGLFILASCLLSQFTGSGDHQHLRTWIVGTFSLGSSILIFIQTLSIKNGERSRGQQACPWSYPFYPHVSGIVLCGIASLRMLSLDYVYSGVGSILERCFYSPLVLAGGFLILKLATCAGKPKLASWSLGLPIVALVLAWPAGAWNIETLNMLGLPAYFSFLAICIASLAFYIHAWKKGVQGSETMFWITLQGCMLVSLTVRDFRGESVQKLWPWLLCISSCALGWRAWLANWPWVGVMTALLMFIGTSQIMTFQSWGFGLYWMALYLIFLFKATRLTQTEAQGFVCAAFVIQSFLFILELFGEVFFKDTTFHVAQLLGLTIVSLGFGLLRPNALLFVVGILEALSLTACGSIQIYEAVTKIHMVRGIVEVGAGFMLLGFAVLLSFRKSHRLAAAFSSLGRKAKNIFAHDEINSFGSFFKKSMVIPGWVWCLVLVFVCAGLLTPAVGGIKHRSPPGFSIDNDLKQIAMSVLSALNSDVRSTFSGIYASPKGIRSLGSEEKGLVEVDGHILDSLDQHPYLETFADYKGRHPYGGFYWYMGMKADGSLKEKYSSVHRIALDIHEPNRGDGCIGIVFADGHGVRFKAPDKKLDFEDVRAILSVDGEESLWGK